MYLVPRTSRFGDVGDIFDDFFGSPSLTRAVSSPRYDLERVGEGTYDISLAVPGFGREEIEISQTDTRLVVKGERGSETGDDGDGSDGESFYVHRGIDRRSFRHSFRLAAGTKVSAATLADGILRLRLESEAAADPRRIEIKS